MSVAGGVHVYARCDCVGLFVGVSGVVGILVGVFVIRFAPLREVCVCLLISGCLDSCGLVFFCVLSVV